MSKDRLLFIDNIRILLIVLVILVHLAITYGAPVGGWYYQGRDYERQAGMIGSFFYVIFLGIIQSFFMGFFFLISGYFTHGSYERKGAGRYLKDRLLRLGIPLLFYILVIDPLINYALALSKGFSGSFLDFLGLFISNYNGLGSGPLWFVETLLFFAVFYILWRLLVKSSDRESKIPGDRKIAVFAIILGIVTFIVRIWLPLGWNYEPLNLQIPYFPQYIVMFIIGLIAFRGNWFLQMPTKKGILWSWIAIALLILSPILLLVYMYAGDPALLAGGLSWQSFTFALWEQFIGVAIIIALTVFYREKFKDQGRLEKAMSESVYSVYVFHAPIIVFLALVLRGIVLDPLLKFILVAPIAIFLCFLVGNYIRKLPIARIIL